MNALAATNEPDHLSYALAYARRGWRVIPIPRGQKHPAIAAWQTAGTTDTQRITHWWTTAPHDGIGIVTGKDSGLFVVDIDVADSKQGDETLAELEATYGTLPPTIEVITGSGGRHLYYAWPTNGQTIRNSASGALGAGIDVRGEGGQVLAPPTVHPNGQRYEAEVSCPAELTQAPGWLLALLDVQATPAITANMPANMPASERPGDIYAATVDWAQILTTDGWTLHHTDPDGENHWTRPGKNTSEGTSATTGYKGSDALKVFTSSVTWLRAEETYSKLGYIAARDHNGDHSAAASALSAQGYRLPPSGNLDDLIAKLPEGPTEPWPDPTPLIETPAVPEFPLDSLPTWTLGHINDIAQAVQVPPDLPANFAIGALAAALTGKATVQISARWTEPTNLYLAVVMRSGAGKSPAEKMAAGWLRKWETTAIAQATPARDKAIMVAKNARARADAANKTAVVGSVGGDDEAWEAQLAAKEAENAIPPLPRLLIDDATPEAVATSLAAYSEHLAILSTEADLFDMALGDGHRKPNINVYLKAWSGDTLIRDRKGSSETGPEMTKLERPLLTVCCAAQPRVLERISADAELVGRGFTQRFMISVPAHEFGSRDYSYRFSDADMPNAAIYVANATTLAERWAGWPGEAIVAFDDEARRTMHAFMAQIEPHLADGAKYAPIAEWVSKCFASVARYAAILHLAEANPPGVRISAATVERAVELGWYWVGHAIATHAAAGDRTTQQAVAILRRLREKDLTDVTISDLQKILRRPGIGLNEAADYIPAVRLLVDNFWLRSVSGDGWHTTLGKGSRSPNFTVSTKVHENDFDSRLSRVSRIAYTEGAKTPPLRYSLPLGTHAIRDPRDPHLQESETAAVDTWQPGDDIFAPIPDESDES